MWRTLFVVSLLVFAGCATEPSGDGVDVEGSTVEGSDAEGSDATASTDRRALTTDTTTRPNPWGEAELTVAIDDRTTGSRDFQPLVAQSLDFWANDSTEHAGYPVDFDLDPDASDPDVVVRFVDGIDSCANVTEPAGCAPFVSGDGDVPRPVTLEVVGSYSNESTLLVIKHELGHVLGLDHSDEPQSVMAPSSELSTLPRTNATERRLPWNGSNFTVYLAPNATDADGSSDESADRIRAQVERALDYYADGANGTVPTNVTYEFVANRTEADVVVAVGVADLPCRVGERGSCGQVHGTDPDGDDALEQYDALRVTLGDVDGDAVGWHVGYWLGYGFGFDETADWPAPFRNASYDDRRDEWWGRG